MESNGSNVAIASGMSISLCDDVLHGYLNANYHKYDGKGAKADNILCESNLRASRGLGSRISDRQIATILADGSSINSLLKLLPSDVDLAELPLDADIPWLQAASEMITRMCNVSGIKLAKTMKSLHLKRPSLFPVLDSVIEGYYWFSNSTLRQKNRNSSWGEYAIDIVHLFHSDLLSMGNHLDGFRALTQEWNMPLSKCRILDALMWISGMTRVTERDWAVYFRDRA